MSRQDVLAFATSADVVVNLAGTLRDAALLDAAAVRAYVDLDPAFTQVWHEQGIDVGLTGHTHHLSVGLSLGAPDCTAPVCGRDWLPVLPPVVLDVWDEATVLERDAFTTVANWRGYGSVHHAGITYGQKAHAWRQLLAVPAGTPRPCTPALAIHRARRPTSAPSPSTAGDSSRRKRSRARPRSTARSCGGPWPSSASPRPAT
jgi:hypothetical protein